MGLKEGDVSAGKRNSSADKSYSNLRDTPKMAG